MLKQVSVYRVYDGYIYTACPVTRQTPTKLHVQLPGYSRPIIFNRQKGTDTYRQAGYNLAIYL